MRRALLVSAVMLGLVCFQENASAQTKPAQRARTTIFAPEMEAGFENAKPPSDAVLDALIKSPEVAETGDENMRPDRESLRKSFEVVPVELGSTDEKDYVVLGGGDYTGADCHWFWIVRVRQGAGQVLLFAPGLVVEILRRKTNGYRDIKESWGGNSGSVTRIFRYSGTKHELVREHSEGPQP